ncbi:MAG: hypothetical protein HY287_06815 [Planctomycetes bacterium]|nr:hypothetical protein [Planctomycetota bacterium]MBI3834026.1 hypothetical protein [Planctomycetota bacterium]
MGRHGPMELALRSARGDRGERIFALIIVHAAHIPVRIFLRWIEVDDNGSSVAGNVADIEVTACRGTGPNEGG